MSTPTDSRTSVVEDRSKADSIRRRIEDEIVASGLEAGARVGAERELAERYQVGRWIIRKALDELQREGLILRTHGRGGGIFVAPQKVVRDLAGLVGLPAYLRAQGMETQTTVLSTATVGADEVLAEQLAVAVGEVAYKVVRLRSASGIPLSIEACHFRADLFPGLLDRSLVGSLYDVLETSYGLERGEAVESIEAVAADHERALALQVVQGSPLLAVTRRASNAVGQVFEFSHELYRGDRIAVKVRTRGTTESGASARLTRRLGTAGSAVPDVDIVAPVAGQRLVERDLVALEVESTVVVVKSSPLDPVG